MKEYQIQIEETGSKGRVFIGDPDKPLAEMTWSRAGEELLIIDHTEVSPSLKGQGIGRKLLDRVVQMARYNSIRILPLCPFAKSVFDKDPLLRDVLK